MEPLPKEFRDLGLDAALPLDLRAVDQFGAMDRMAQQRVLDWIRGGPDTDARLREAVECLRTGEVGRWL